jgi:methylated-DNA-[protein]-cysteine S-methyltransferase
MKLLIDRIESPLGTILLVVDRDRLCALDFAVGVASRNENRESRMMKLLHKRYESFDFVESKLPDFSSKVRAYLNGDYGSLEDIPLNAGGTDFQQLVWQNLRKIPVGTTASYGQIAANLGKPTAARAVGMANSLNPIGIVVPCHRVIGANAQLTGYAGGLERKQWLLQHEGVPNIS